MTKEKKSSRIIFSEETRRSLQALPFFAAVLDGPGHVVFFNRKAEELSGCLSEKAEGQDFADSFLSEEQRGPFRERFLDGRQNGQAGGPFACVLTAPKGAPLYMEWTGVRSEGPGQQHLILVGMDLTGVFSRVSELLSQIMHDINNATTFIIGNTPFLRESWDGMRSVLDESRPAHPDMEIARLPYEFFRNEYPQVLEDIETGCRRIRSVAARFKEIERMIHDEKDSRAGR